VRNGVGHPLKPAASAAAIQTTGVIGANR